MPRGATLHQAELHTHTEQEAVSVLEHLGSQTDQTKDKKVELRFLHVSHSRSQGSEEELRIQAS